MAFIFLCKSTQKIFGNEFGEYVSEMKLNFFMKTLGTLLLLAGFFMTLFSGYKTIATERQDSDYFVKRDQSVQWIPAISSVMIVVGVVTVVVGRKKKRFT
jgi:ribose/xylose/arabinose/galactoside ABC-type transport system permease subunit